MFRLKRVTQYSILWGPLAPGELPRLPCPKLHCSGGREVSRAEEHFVYYFVVACHVTCQRRAQQLKIQGSLCSGGMGEGSVGLFNEFQQLSYQSNITANDVHLFLLLPSSLSPFPLLSSRPPVFPSSGGRMVLKLQLYRLNINLVPAPVINAHA